MQHVAYHRLAARELVASAKYYERRCPGLGDEFLDAVESATLDLRAHPEAGRREPHRASSWRIARFPYRLFYTAQPDRIWIVAVAHLSRRPGYWLRRMT
ncbi:MAG TPA: type II toxin-antitoxin system RelE/ParE family toxin [Candidatus Paceibacterota bacterium]|nr:type II toxin-antitoxin system RelE/ParE family toxin [Verrucomicrobiota bacterium]HRZ46614.1 type II toxin-antitoxin system RelE/ParE family toxin [Candidatus Paceibacterota bacterium]HRZ92478.1 type II toxin-antitoxin system RelE/ParE family toxin [Candidatus Paceibacterota bacterium]